jgi:hypothetical protein
MNVPETSRKEKRRRPGKKPWAKPPAASSLGQGVSAEAGRRAAVVLEVLAGERTPQQAAAVLSMSVAYFYLLERKALQGLLRGCEVPAKGPPPPSAERKLAAMEGELARCRRECQRQAALVRATQRAVGLPASPSAEAEKAAHKTGPRRRPRRATVRALRAAQVVRNNSTGQTGPPELQRSSTEEGRPASASSEKETEHGSAGG